MAVITEYEPFISRRSARRKPSAIRKLTPLSMLPGVISLAGGLPNPTSFPFTALTVELRDGTTLQLSPEQLATSLQYSATPGLGPLLDRLRQMQRTAHAPPYENWDLLVAPGSQDLLSKVFDMLLNEGDTLLMEEPTYSGALAAVAPLGCQILGVPTDAAGIIPEALEDLLKSGLPLRVLYTIPTGQNPSGCTTSAERRRKVYALASEYNFIILEDDPYFNLYLDEGPQPPSYLSLDTDGRVIRMESFSKVLSSGIRVGFATGPKRLIDQLQLDLQATCMHASGLSQVIVMQLLEQWGDQGWAAHIARVKALYRGRRDFFLKLCDEHLTGLAEWGKPSAGMFVWFRLIGIEDSSKLITEKARSQKVLMVPGESFLTDPTQVSPHVRAAYSIATEDQMAEGVRRFAALLRAEREAQQPDGHA
eukprot:EG_transcript_9071